MIGLDTLVAFCLASALMSLSPGPSNMYIMARSIAQGRQAGVAAATGMAAGSMLYVLASALGLASVFAVAPMAYLGIKLAGALYLLYLGAQAWQSAPFDGDTTIHLRHQSHRHIRRQSLIVELTNPKTALFFLAFLPQFVDTQQQSLMLQFILLGVLYSLIAFCSDILVATASGRLGTALKRHPHYGQWLDRLSGAILIGLGLTILYQLAGSSFH